MDLQAAETAHKREDKVEAKKSWACPCNGCAKAVKQERKRILDEIENIDLSKLNGQEEMRKYLFRCKTCSTVMSIETELEDKYIHLVPPCPCGKSRMQWLGSDEYKYNL
jgi:hypothetical protein